MAWSLVRLDDRLLHGQVAVGWVAEIHPRLIVVADDRLAASGWERDMVESSAPEGVQVRVVAVDEAARLQPPEAEHAILLLRSPAELLRMVQAGAAPREVNVGGLHLAAGKRRVLDYIYVDPQDAAALRAAASAGSHITAQDVPGNPARELLALLSRAGL